jgi:hypothetical protein
MLTEARTEMTVRTLLKTITKSRIAVMGVTFQPHCPQGKAPSIEHESDGPPPLLLCEF